MKSTVFSYLQLAARIVLGVVFIYASAHKIMEPEGFAEAIANYQILPAALVNPSALLLPWVELVCGICLVFGVLSRGSALILAALLVIFIWALGFSIYRGLDISCGCFSTSNGGIGSMYADIAADLLLLSIALWVLFRPSKTKSIPITPYRSKRS